MDQAIKYTLEHNGGMVDLRLGALSASKALLIIVVLIVGIPLVIGLIFLITAIVGR